MSTQHTPEALADLSQLMRSHGSNNTARGWLISSLDMLALLSEVRAAATAAERERCAKIADWGRLKLVADEIRRGQ